MGIIEGGTDGIIVHYRTSGGPSSSQWVWNT
jgi:hypothetical protein